MKWLLKLVLFLLVMHETGNVQAQIPLPLTGRVQAPYPGIRRCMQYRSLFWNGRFLEHETRAGEDVYDVSGRLHGRLRYWPDGALQEFRKYFWTPEGSLTRMEICVQDSTPDRVWEFEYGADQELQRLTCTAGTRKGVMEKTGPQTWAGSIPAEKSDFVDDHWTLQKTADGWTLIRDIQNGLSFELTEYDTAGNPVRQREYSHSVRLGRNQKILPGSNTDWHYEMCWTWTSEGFPLLQTDKGVSSDKKWITREAYVWEYDALHRVSRGSHKYLDRWTSAYRIVWE